MLEKETENYQADYRKCGKEMLIDLINWANRRYMTTTLKPDSTHFSTPKVLEGKDVNTMISITQADGLYVPKETETIEYNRVDINQVAKSLHFDGVLFLDFVPDKKEYNTLDILDALYKVVPIKLLEEDVIVETFNIDKNEPSYDTTKEDYNPNKVKGIQFNIKMSPSSIAYIGTLELEIRPRPIHIETAIRKTRYTHSFQPWRHYGLGV